MKTSSLYDVQKRAEAGAPGAGPPPPARPGKPCLCALVVLSLLIVLSLAVALTLLLTGPDWLRLSYTGHTGLTKTVSSTEHLKTGEDGSATIKSKPEPETSSKDDIKVSTTASPATSALPTPEPRAPTTKMWFKEVVFFKPRPVTTSSSETKITVTKTGDKTDATLDEKTPEPKTKTIVVTKSVTSGNEERNATKKALNMTAVHELFASLFPDFNEVFSGDAHKDFPFLSAFLPKTKSNQTDSKGASEDTVQTTSTPSSEDNTPTPSPASSTASPSPASSTATPSPASSTATPGRARSTPTPGAAAGSTPATPDSPAATVPAARSPPTDPPTATGGPSADGARRKGTTRHGQRVRRDPNWIFATGNARAFAHGQSRAQTGNRDGFGSSPGSGSYVHTFNRAKSGVTRSWTTKDESRNGVNTHTETDKEVRQPMQRSAGGFRLVYDGATGTWRHVKLPTISATYNPPQTDTSDAWTRPTWKPVTMRPWNPRPMPTLKPWVFTSPAATGSWGVFGDSHSPTPRASAVPEDPFAAARRRIEEAKRRIRQYHQDMGGFTGFTNWG